MQYTHAKRVIRESFEGVFDITARTIKDLSDGIGLEGDGHSSSEESDMSDFD